ncbi:uncharacterized protein [Pyrus communis]|uniref:uncharacterized protein n=1 Tax=Pyrus communis TaxID=23211 RepID=UPI0035BF189D
MELEEDDFDDERDGEEEEEESENEEEDGEEVGEEENGDGQRCRDGRTRERIHESSSAGAALWDKALEFRFLLQKAFSSSHGIMDYHSCMLRRGRLLTEEPLIVAR